MRNLGGWVVRVVRGKSVLTAVVGVVGVVGVATAAPLKYDPVFDVPPGLQKQVDFWVDIFTLYSRWQVLVHDTEHPERVYRLLDFRDRLDAGASELAVEAERKAVVEEEKERIRAGLRRIQSLGPKSADLTAEERRWAKLFHGDPDPGRFAAAAEPDRIRAQIGVKERFAEGVAVAQRYLPELERVFRDEGVPLAVTRLPLVESSFNVRAYSKVGASGIWQFMPTTARRFMRIDNAVDERLDPSIATHAAARFLRENYDTLGTWPLAITAYNHGPGGVARAVSELGTTDISEIVHRYRGRSFGFASRNFYAEFLAAIDVERDYLQYYGPLPLHRPVTTETVRLDRYVPIDAVARCGGIDVEDIRDLNPALLPGVYQGRQHVPRDYALRLPAGKQASFERCYASLPTAKKSPAQKRAYATHRVRRGQTLAQIARQYRTSVTAIRRSNGLRGKQGIRAGQVLQIPTG
jgi:membrane-bound lytic murein transglycosylase D